MSQDLFGAMSISASGMSAQRKRMDAIAKNLANSETTRAADGETYKRHTVVIRSSEAPTAPLQVPGMELPVTRTSPEHLTSAPPMLLPMAPTSTVEAQEVVDPTAGVTLVFNPQHPDAGPDGYVRMPDVDTVSEMVDMVAATRAYEANLAAMKAYQNIVTKSLEI